MKLAIESVQGINTEGELLEGQLTFLYNPGENNPFLGIMVNSSDHMQIILNPWKIQKYEEAVVESRLQREAQKIKPLKVDVSDQIKTSESLTNNKPWFNGMKTFSSVKANPAPINDPNVLEINVVDNITADSGLV